MISVCILTKNAAVTLSATLESTRTFAEVIVLDNGSTDQTEAIARSFPNVRYFTSPFIGFGPLRNQAAALASNDWILALDSDEILSPSLIQELHHLIFEHDAYSIPRQNYYNGKQINGCGWGEEQISRLYTRKKTSYCNSQVHESLLFPAPYPLRSPLFHTPYHSTEQFLAKMQHYSTLFAQQHKGKKNSSFTKALFHALFAFFRSYILKKGLLYGKEGFIISLYNANTAFYKYLKLAEENQKA